jgi:hypothetical protein
MKISQLKELVRQVVKEENDYQQLFKHMLDKCGKSITDMSDDEKKKFFNAVDTAYKAKSEGRLKGYNSSVNEASQTDILNQIEKLRVAANSGKITGAQFMDKFYPLWKQIKGLKEEDLPGNQEKLDTDKDGEIEASDLAALRAKNEGVKKKK